MSWFIWILISVITTAIANIFQRVLMREKDNDPYGTTVIFLFAAAFLTGLFALWKGFVYPPIGAHVWNFAGSMFCWGVGTIFLFLAYQVLGSSEVAIISAFGSVVTIITALMFLGETFTFQKSIGVLLIICSILLLNLKKGMSFFNKGMIYALISTILFGVAVTNDAFILRSYDAVSYTSVSLLLPALLLLILRPKTVSTFKRLGNNLYTKHQFFVAIFYSAQAIAYYVALQMGRNSSQIAPIYKSNIILTVILAMIFLKERDNKWMKLCSAILVTVGVLLIK